MQLVSFDNLDDPVAALRRGQSGARPLVTGVGEDTQNEREQSSRALVEHGRGAVAILDTGRMNSRAQQQTEGVYEKMALLALDLLSRVVAMRIAEPPFSALFTL